MGVSDGASYEAQGVHLACRELLDVSVRGYKRPLLIAMVLRHDGVCMMWQEELQLGPNAGAHRGGDALLCQYPSRVDIVVCLRFLDVYGCYFADLELVVMCRPV